MGRRISDAAIRWLNGTSVQRRGNPMAEWDVASATHRGRVRRRNEDAILVRPAIGLYAVADGMGGHAAGNVASSVAVATLDRAIAKAPSPLMRPRTMGRRLRAAFVQANADILARAAERRNEAGMGTTLTALVTLRGACCVIAHVGDSRAYLHRPTETPAFRQLTRDHTWVQEQVDIGALASAEARVHPYSSILMRVLGMEQPGPADLVTVEAGPGDTLLLCSDGLTGMVEDEGIAEIVARRDSLDDIAAALIDAANGAGGRDNISVIVLRPRF